MTLKYRVCALLLALSTAAFAAEVDLAHAKAFAKGWRGRNVRAARTHRTSAGESRFHVVAFEGGGWAAVGADDEDAPVIAFSDKGEDIVEDDRNPIWFLVKRDAEWRAEVRREMKRRGEGRGRARHKGWDYKRKRVKVEGVGQGEGEGLDQVALATTANPSIAEGALEDVRVEPLVKSTWNQKTIAYNRPCYNYYTPNNWYCGCVATAIAQVMRYHEWPRTALTSKTKRCWVGGVATDLTTTAEAYDWSKMPLIPNVDTDLESRKEIGRLCSDVGIIHQMQYSSGASGTYLALAKSNLVNDLGYKFARYVNYRTFEEADYVSESNPFNLSQFKTIVITNCDAGMPVCLGIGKSSNDNTGHAVVADGYGYSDDAFYVHINGGWGGSGNMWYCPPQAIFTDNYDVISDVIYNIFPDTQGPIVSGRVLDNRGKPIADADVDFYTVSGGRTNVLGSATTNAKGIYAWIRGINYDTTCYVRASHPDSKSDSIVESSRKITIKKPSTYEPGELLDDGRMYVASKVYGFNLGNQDGVDFTLDIHRSIPKVLFR